MTRYARARKPYKKGAADSQKLTNHRPGAPWTVVCLPMQKDGRFQCHAPYWHSAIGAATRAGSSVGSNNSQKWATGHYHNIYWTKSRHLHE
jgi:hypothetical protein